MAKQEWHQFILLKSSQHFFYLISASDQLVKNLIIKFLTLDPSSFRKVLSDVKNYSLLYRCNF